MKPKLYFPSSGSEGSHFESRLCRYCTKAAIHEGEPVGCENIYGRAFWDAYKPSEWVWVSNPQHPEQEAPWCLAFLPKEGPVTVDVVMEP